MGTYEELLKLLREKKERFLEYESVTVKMNQADADHVDTITEAVSRRQNLIWQIDTLDGKITALCRELPDGELVYEASKNRCDYSSLNEEQREIYTAGQEIFLVIGRIQEEEVLAAGVMNLVVEQLENRIRRNHQGRKFAGYFKNMNQSMGSGFLYDKKR